MRTQYNGRCSRRRFLGGLTLTGAAGLLGLPPRPVAAEPPPEIRKIRLVKIPPSAWRQSIWRKSCFGWKASLRWNT